MIKVDYIGRFGNTLFQYCLGRILAEEKGYALVAEPLENFPATSEKVNGLDFSNSNSFEFKGHTLDFESLINDQTPKNIVMKGFFQRYEYYREYKDRIKNWLQYEPFRDVSEEDIVIHVRVGDFRTCGYMAPESFYAEALSRSKYKNVYMVTDDPHDPFVKRLAKRFDAKIFHSGTDFFKDFRFMASFSKIVMSQSTFSWWAAFLSKAEEIYYPVSPKGYWGDLKDEDLRVSDEPRYIFIAYKEKYKPSFLEVVYSLPTKLSTKFRNYMHRL